MISTTTGILSSLILLEKVEKNMFGKTQEVKLTMTGDVATGVESSTEKGMVAGALAHVTSHLSKDTVVIGAGRTLGAAALLYGAMVLTNQQVTGALRFNPFSAG